jgi:hypothetical protein
MSNNSHKVGFISLGCPRVRYCIHFPNLEQKLSAPYSHACTNKMCR